MLNLNLTKTNFSIAAWLIFFQFSVAQNFAWAKKLGSTSEDVGYSVVLDSYRNVYVAWNTSITKFDSSGTLLWTKATGGDCYAIAIDASRNLYTSGTSSSTTLAFISKHDSSGTLLWTTKTTNSTTVANSVAVDSLGNVYASGYFYGNVDFDPSLGSYNIVAMGEDIFVWKLNALGGFVWAKAMGKNSAYDRGHAMTIDAAGYIYATGYFVTSGDFDMGPASVQLLSVKNSADVFITKADANGGYVWAKKLGGDMEDHGAAITVDAFGNVYTTGHFNDTCDFDPGPGVYNLISSGSSDIFVSKLSASGNFLWAKKLGGTSEDKAMSLTVDAFGNVYTTGYFMGTADFDPGPGIFNLISIQTSDIFICKLNAAGHFVWANSMGGSLDQVGYSIAVDTSRNVYTTGKFSATCDFNPGAGIFNLTSAGLGDVFVQKMWQDQCTDISLVVDSVSHVTCTGSGYVLSHAINGTPPYAYTWNTTPPVNDSVLQPAQGGIYQLSINDARGCKRTTSLLVTAPSSQPGFDLNTNLLASSFRPGFTSAVWLDAFNIRCAPASGDVKLVLDGMVNYTSAIPAPDLISGDTLIWHFINLTYDSVHIMPKVALTTSTLTAIGDSICFTTIVTPITGDMNVSNNSKYYCFPVTGSYDPNDKQIFPQGVCTEKHVQKDQEITYLIRFQNTGNAEAIHVYVLDTLDTNFDMNTLNVTGSSHSLITEILNGNVLKFRFDSIMLPDSTSNEPDSHGHVIYEVRPKAGLANGIQVKNTSYIYFDYNDAVQTNTMVNTLIDVIPLCSPFTGMEKNIFGNSMLYPNPTDGKLTFESKQQYNSLTIYIRNVYGQLVSSQIYKANLSTFEIKGAPGLYFIEVLTNEGHSTVFRIVKN